MRTTGLFAACAAVSALALAGMASPSFATPVYVTYTGTISGKDALGDFGAVGAPINAAYTANYEFNVDYSSSLNADKAGDGTTSPGINYIYGGSFYSNDSPAVFASITVGLTTISKTGGNILGEIYGLNYGGTDGYTEQIHYFGADGFFLTNNIFNSKGTLGLTASIETPFSYTVGSGDNSNGNFCEVIHLNATAEDCLSLTPQTLTVSLTAPTAVPNPPTLPLMASGMVALAFLRWRRGKSRSKPAH